MRDSDYYDYSYKIVLIGDSAVGKTNILSQFTREEFSEDTKTTVGVEFANKQITVGDKIIKAQMWDTAGQERYRAITSAYYKGAHGAFIVFDITKIDTFNNVDRWFKEIKESTSSELPIILLGNKNDLKHLRQVPTDVSIQYAQKNQLVFMETSAKSSFNINEAFNKLIQVVHEKNRSNQDSQNQKNNKTITRTVPIEPEKKSGCC